MAIGKVKGLLGQESDVDVVSDVQRLEEAEAMLKALSELNRGKTETLLSGVLKEYPLNIVIEQLINPVFEALDLVKVSQRSLQLGLFQTCLITRLAWLSILKTKRPQRANAYCLALTKHVIQKVGFKQQNCVNRAITLL